MSTSWSDKLKDVAVTALQKLDESGIKDQATEKLQQTKKFLDENGVTERYVQATDTLSDHLDTMAGVKQLALVEERLSLQTQYNDILATKISEALERIEVLESRLSELTGYTNENRRVS